MFELVNVLRISLADVKKPAPETVEQEITELFFFSVYLTPSRASLAGSSLAPNGRRRKL